MSNDYKASNVAHHMCSSSQPPDVSTIEGPQVNRFEQLSSLGYQMSLAGSWGPVHGGGWYTVRSNSSWVIVT